MRGKYSPTVNAAYAKSQAWFDHYAAGNCFDPEGFDSYGYNNEGIDRAGNQEMDYGCDDIPGSGINSRYEAADQEWGFDGTKPVRLKVIALAHENEFTEERFAEAARSLLGDAVYAGYIKANWSVAQVASEIAIMCFVGDVPYQGGPAVTLIRQVVKNLRTTGVTGLVG